MGFSRSARAQTGGTRTKKGSGKIIAVEEHFTTEEYSDYLYTRTGMLARSELIEDAECQMVKDWMTPDMSAII